MQLREANNLDIPQLMVLYEQTVRTVCAKDYTSDQIEVWATACQSISLWEEWLMKHYFVVAVQNGLVIGFSSLDKGGYFNLLYVHQDYQGMGVGRRLVAEIEEKAKNSGEKSIYSSVSITARPFFSRVGFVKESIDIRELNGQVFENALMRKQL